MNFLPCSVVKKNKRFFSTTSGGKKLRGIQTISLVRRHVNRMEYGKPFSIRDLLAYGRRKTIGQYVYRMVKGGYLMRLAAGVLMRAGPATPRPAAGEVAEVKARAFARRIGLHGAEAASRVGLTPSRTKKEPIFYTNGRSTSFRYGSVRIHLKMTSQRRLEIADADGGAVVRALWFLGRRGITGETAARAWEQLTYAQRKEIRIKVRSFPQWLAESLSWLWQFLPAEIVTGPAKPESRESLESMLMAYLRQVESEEMDKHPPPETDPVFHPT